MDKDTLKQKLDQLKKDLKLKQKKLEKADRIEKAKRHVQQKIKEQAELFRGESPMSRLESSNSDDDFKNNTDIDSEKAVSSGKKTSVSFMLADQENVPRIMSPKMGENETESVTPDGNKIPGLDSKSGEHENTSLSSDNLKMPVLTFINNGATVDVANCSPEKEHVPGEMRKNLELMPSPGIGKQKENDNCGTVSNEIKKPILAAIDTIDDSQIQFQEMSSSSSRVPIKKNNKSSIRKDTTTKRRKSIKLSPIPKMLPIDQEEIVTIENVKVGDMAFIGTQKSQALPDLKDEHLVALKDKIDQNADDSRIQENEMVKSSVEVVPETPDAFSQSTAEIPDTESESGSVSLISNKKQNTTKDQKEINIVPDSVGSIESDQSGPGTLNRKGSRRRKSEVQPEGITLDFSFLEDESGDMYSQIKCRRSKRNRKSASRFSSSETQSTCEASTNSEMSILECAGKSNSDNIESPVLVTSRFHRVIPDSSPVPQVVKNTSSAADSDMCQSPKPTESISSVGLIFPKFPNASVTSGHEQEVVEFSLPDEEFDLYKLAKEVQKSVENTEESIKTTTDFVRTAKHKEELLPMLTITDKPPEHEDRVSKMSEKSVLLSNEMMEKERMCQMSERSTLPSDKFRVEKLGCLIPEDSSQAQNNLDVPEKVGATSETPRLLSNSLSHRDENCPKADMSRIVSRKSTQEEGDECLTTENSSLPPNLNISQSLFPDSVSTFDSIFDSCSNSVSTQSLALASQTSEPTRKTRTRWGKLGKRGRLRKETDSSRESTQKSKALVESLDSMDPVQVKDDEVPVAQPVSKCEEPIVVTDDLPDHNKTQEDSHIETVGRNNNAVNSPCLLTQEKSPDKVLDQTDIIVEKPSDHTRSGAGLYESQVEELFSQPSAPDNSALYGSIQWTLLSSHQLESEDKVICLDYTPWLHSDISEDVILCCTTNSVTLLKSGDSEINTLAHWSLQPMKVCQAVLYVEGSSVCVFTVESMEDNSERSSISTNMEGQYIINCYYWTGNEQKSIELDRFSGQEESKPILCVGTCDLFVSHTTPSQKSQVTKYQIPEGTEQLSPKTDFEVIEDKLICILPVKKIDTALVGLSESTLYIWNSKQCLLLLTIGLSLPQTRVQSVTAEAGLLFLSCLRYGGDQCGYLLAVNPNTSKSATINKYESAIEGQTHMATCASSRDGHLCALYSDGTVNLWSELTGKLLGHKTDTGIDQLALHSTATTLVCKTGTKLYTFKYNITS